MPKPTAGQDAEREWPAEEWRGIPGFSNYEASSLGRIRSVPRTITVRCGERTYERPILSARILKPFRCGSGGAYEQVSLGRGKREYVQRLVALAFHGPAPEGKPEAAHRNGRSHDNRAGNLRWSSHAENEQDKREHGTYFSRRGLVGEKHHKAKLSDAVVKSLRSRFRGTRGEATALAAEFGVDRSTIARVRAGKGWSHV